MAASPESVIISNFLIKIMLKFLHTADIHLDSPLLNLEHYEGAPVEALWGASRRALESLVTLAVHEQTDFILIAGDLYDGNWKDYSTGLYFVSQMSRLREAGIPVFIVAGNHDAASRMTKTLRLPDNVHLFPTNKPGTVPLDNFGVAIHGQGFSKPAVKEDLSRRYPQAIPGCFNIGMLHTGATGSESHDPYAPCTVDGLCSKNYDYWALGHLHQREMLHHDPPIVFSGNIQGRHIRETGPKGCMLVTVPEHGETKVDFQPLDSIRWAKADIDALKAADEDEVMERIREKLESLLEKNDGLPLASRIEITLPSRLCDRLLSPPEQWINQVRSLAIDSGGGRIWVEKVRLLHHRPGEYQFFANRTKGS